MSDAMKDCYDLIIIGAGPGGYCAAIRAAQLGLDTAIIEKDQPGGVCLNWGCIPSKNLIHQAEQFHGLTAMEAVGVTVDRSTLDYSAVQKGSRKVVATLTNGVRGLLKKNKVDYIAGTAQLAAADKVIVDDERTLQAKNILVATGSRPMQIAGFECDEERVLSSTGILALEELPGSLVILGGGAIGCEFAYVMSSFGVKVTLVEAMDHLLPAEDREVCAVLENSFRNQGIEVLTATRAGSLSRGPDGVSVTLTTPQGGETTREADFALVVFGRVPNTDDLGLEEIGVAIDDRGYVRTGDYNASSVPGVFAIGDITRTPALAHVASREGEITVEYLAGHEPHTSKVDPLQVPSAIYSEPQVAGFGLREEEAVEKGVKFKKSVFHYPGAGKSIAIGKPEGLVKILCDADSDEIIGAHIVGHNATELIHELQLASGSELLPEDIERMIHAHPTLAEALQEAARGINGRPIHA
jgi:dihydrolipoamide dehydrogenase